MAVHEDQGRYMHVAGIVGCEEVWDVERLFLIHET
jgi:hypothetical protein